MASHNYSLPLEGKIALVTGASRGIGEGIALDLARRGADTVILGYTSPSSEAKVKAIAAQIEALPHKPTAYPAQGDLSTVDGPGELVASLLRWRPGLQLDILVNNAGVDRVCVLGSVSAADYAAVFDVNVRGAVLLAQAALPCLRAPARIVNIGSVGARRPFAGLGLYCASKAALEGLTRCWAAELGARGTTVNCVEPGPVQTEMLANIPAEHVARQRAETPIGNRLGTVEEVARVVSMLAGPEGAWITGQCISASGGWAMY